MSLNDCYFFYYSTCSKGSNCPFRHEPSALSTEVTCIYWQAGNCTNENCSFRHMDTSALPKSKSTIYCYWESQVGGCQRRPTCSFRHRNPEVSIAAPITQPLSTKILVNKAKLQELGGLILPVNPQSNIEVSYNGEEGVHARYVPRTSVKDRLGKRKTIKDRLGLPKHSCSNSNNSDSESELKAVVVVKSKVLKVDKRVHGGEKRKDEENEENSDRRLTGRQIEEIESKNLGNRKPHVSSLLCDTNDLIIKKRKKSNYIQDNNLLSLVEDNLFQDDTINEALTGSLDVIKQLDEIINGR